MASPDCGLQVSPNILCRLRNAGRYLAWYELTIAAREEGAVPAAERHSQLAACVPAACPAWCQAGASALSWTEPGSSLPGCALTAEHCLQCWPCAGRWVPS